MSRRSKKKRNQDASARTPAAGGKNSVPKRSTWKVTGICALLAALVLMVFAQTAGFNFVNYDDDAYVYLNQDAAKGLSATGVAHALTQREIGLWTPLVAISHLVDCQLYGLWAGGHHLTNVLLHLASTILLFLILRQMTGTLWRSAFVAMVFAIHPLRVESVAWISERKDVLSGLFFMLTLGAYWQYVRRSRSTAWYLATLILFAMGLMCKPMLVTLPCVLLLLDYWPLKRLSHQAFLEKTPLLALSLGMCAATMLGPRQVGAIAITPIPLWTRMAEGVVSTIIYLIQMILPARLAVIYPLSEDSLQWWPGALAVLAGLSLGAYLVRQRHPYLWMGWLWNLGMLAPVSGILQVSRHAQADHYNYLPQIGIYIGFTWLVADWAEERRHGRVLLSGVAAIVTCILCVLAFNQTTCWRDSFSLWTHTLECTGNNSAARYNFGNYLLDQGRTQDAVAQYREAVRVDPDCAEAHYNLGNVLLNHGQLEEAVSHYRKVLQIDRTSAVAMSNLGVALFRQGGVNEAIDQLRQAVRTNPDLLDARNNLSSILLETGQTDEAITQLREALRIKSSAEGRFNLGNVLLNHGRTEEATSEYREALRINPALAEAHSNLGTALFQQGRMGEGITESQKALDLRPDDATFERNLAWMLATAPQAAFRNGARSLELALKANQANGGKDRQSLRTLAAAYAEAGQFPEAVQAATEALHLVDAESSTPLARSLREEIRLYEAGHRFEPVH